MTGDTSVRVKKVRTTQFQDSLNTPIMGSSCSTQLAEFEKKVKNLEARVKLYEAGITDASMHEMHSSQTNIGLVNVGTENSSNGCECSTSIWGILEVLALIVVVVLFIYIAYNCMVSYCTRRRRTKEMERRKFVEQMENKFRTPQDHRAIQLGPTAPSECNRAHMHAPKRYQNPQTPPQQPPQQPQSSTFE